MSWFDVADDLSMAGSRRGRLAVEEKKKQNTADGRGDQREDDDAVAEQNATGYPAGPWINR